MVTNYPRQYRRFPDQSHLTQITFQLRVTAAPGVIGLPVLLHTLKFTLLAVGYFTMVSIAPG